MTAAEMVKDVLLNKKYDLCDELNKIVNHILSKLKLFATKLMKKCKLPKEYVKIFKQILKYLIISVGICTFLYFSYKIMPILLYFIAAYLSFAICGRILVYILQYLNNNMS